MTDVAIVPWVSLMAAVMLPSVAPAVWGRTHVGNRLRILPPLGLCCVGSCIGLMLLEAIVFLIAPLSVLGFMPPLCGPNT